MMYYWTFVFGFILCSSSVNGGVKLTYIDLINRLTNLERLATLPVPGEKANQWSSYDRASRYDETSGEYIRWSANSDGTGIIREINGKQVLAEMEGHGVIWRIWSANPGQGHVRIYLDGSDEPAVDLPFIGYFDRKNEPFTASKLVHYSARGYNCYVPIPYQKSCRIVADSNWGEYYHFTYTIFPKGTQVPTFTRNLSHEERAALDRANEILSQCGIDPTGDRQGQTIEKERVTILPGETVTIMYLNGTRAITGIRVDVDVGEMVTIVRLGSNARIIKPYLLKRELPDTPEYRDVLRELTFHIYWDEETQPSVWAPLGDFFGTAPGWNPYRSLPMGITEDGFYSFWYMPFEKSAILKLSNDGTKERTVSFEVTHAPLSRPIGELGRFHVKWHRDMFLPSCPGRIGVDWTLLKTKGTGRFCGVMLHVSNPEGGWWGEGDEKFFVDNEKFPSIFGTGTDDYFGFAFASPRMTSHGYHNQTVSALTTWLKYHGSMNRWHIPDDVPFQNSFEGSIGKMYPNSRSTHYAATVYWYQAAGQTDRYSQIPIEDRVGYWPLQTNFGLEGCFEGEDLEILKITGGDVNSQYVEGLHTGSWSGSRGKVHLWWNEAEPGHTLELSLPVKKTGTYRIWTQLIRSNDYGTVQLYLNARKLGDPIDLYNEAMKYTGPLDMKIHQLDKGTVTLRVEMKGANPKAEKGYSFALDYIQMKEIDPFEDPAFEENFVCAGEFTRIYDPSVGEPKTRDINDHCFFRGSDSVWHFFGITDGATVFAHATADSLLQIPWIKQAYPMTAVWDPWKEIHLWSPHIIFHEGTYYMFYCPGDKDDNRFKIHLATSSDLWTWTRHSKNPLFFDGFHGRDPMVIPMEDKWVMYYTANSDPAGGNHIVACRTSDDLITWGDRHVVFIDPCKQKWGGPTESPTVIRRGEYYYLFIGPRQGYVGTDVFRSKDPFRWRLEDKVGHIEAHAAEVVRDEKGRWYVSHCGFEEGGLYLAPLYWNDGLDDADSSLPVQDLE